MREARPHIGHAELLNDELGQLEGPSADRLDPPRQLLVAT